MAYRYNVKVIIAKLEGIIPLFGCYIELCCGDDKCIITTGLGEKHPEAKIDLIIKHAMVDGFISSKETEYHFFKDMNEKSCIPNVDKALLAAIKQEYHYYAEIK